MSEITWKKGAQLLYSKLPDFVREEYDNYVRFLEVYNKFKDDDVRKGIVNFLINRDVDLTDDKWLDLFHDEYAIRLPKTMLEDRRLVYKFIKDFYRAKGTEQATRFLFRLLFNEEIEFYYPGRDLLRPSNSKWSKDISLRINSFINEDIFDYVGTQIIGVDSGAKTKVEKIISYINEDQIIIYELFYTKATEAFNIDEFIKDEDNNTLGKILDKIEYPGKYLSYDGHTSSFKKIQDSYYYQEYSYVIKSGISLNLYKDILINLTHPAGTKVFAEFSMNIEFDLTVPTVDIDEKIVRFDSTNINDLMPTTWAETSDYLQTVIGYLITIPVIDVFSIEHEDYVFDAAIDGNVKVSDSELISDVGGYLIKDFANWTVSDFIGGKGIIGANTSFLTDLDINNKIKVQMANTAYEINEVISIDSDITMTTKMKTLYDGFTNATIHKNLLD